MLLYFAARAQNFDEWILPAWQRGSHRVLAIASPTRRWRIRAGAASLGPDVVMQLHDIACHGLHPDLTICIDIDPETGLERTRTRNGSSADRMDEQAIEFHRGSVRSILNSAAGILSGSRSSMAMDTIGGRRGTCLEDRESPCLKISTAMRPPSKRWSR